MTKTVQEHEKRLEQIAQVSFGTLTDDEILTLLAERKQLEILRAQYLEAQQAQEHLSQAKAEKVEIEKELARLNSLISPDKPDDDLIHLIEERRGWEAKLDAVNKTLGEIVETKAPEKTPLQEDADVADAKPDPTPVSATERAVSESLPSQPAPSESQPEGGTEEDSLSLVVDKDFGEQRITDIAVDPNSELGRYLERMEANPESLGRILDDLPVSARRDKAFMLAVAEIDPAYAMHYADKDVLKRDEDFNLKVVALKGKRQSGSVLAEMPPEARTEAVVMAAVRRDYRDIRFALPQMKTYDALLERAKKATLEKVKELRESADIAILVPKILQKDKSFMAEVEKLVAQSDDK